MLSAQLACHATPLFLGAFFLGRQPRGRFGKFAAQRVLALARGGQLRVGVAQLFADGRELDAALLLLRMGLLDQRLANAQFLVEARDFELRLLELFGVACDSASRSASCLASVSTWRCNSASAAAMRACSTGRGVRAILGGGTSQFVGQLLQTIGDIALETVELLAMRGQGLVRTAAALASQAFGRRRCGGCGGGRQSLFVHARHFDWLPRPSPLARLVQAARKRRWSQAVGWTKVVPGSPRNARQAG